MAKKSKKREVKEEKISDDHVLIIMFIAECKNGTCEREISQFIGDAYKKLLALLERLELVVSKYSKIFLTDSGWEYYAQLTA